VRTDGWSWGTGRCSKAAARRSRAAGGGLLQRGGAPAAMGEGGWAWELCWGEVKPFPGSVGAEGVRRRGLRVEAMAAAPWVRRQACPRAAGGRGRDVVSRERRRAR
jgi:hypothetical protein